MYKNPHLERPSGNAGRSAYWRSSPSRQQTPVWKGAGCQGSRLLRGAAKAKLPASRDLRVGGRQSSMPPTAYGPLGAYGSAGGVVVIPPVGGPPCWRAAASQRRGEAALVWRGCGKETTLFLAPGLGSQPDVWVRGERLS